MGSTSVLQAAMPAPDPWVPVNSEIGFTDYVCAGLQAIGSA
jgi:hypothetical protein